ncbi:MAG: cyclic-di-AMP receptor [Anaerolineales bacterium]|jgi:uncharacterized protein YaaQ
MKMIVCILQDNDKDQVVKALNNEGFQVTVLPSTGGYFRRGNSTLMIGTEDDCVDQAIAVIKENSQHLEEQGLKRATVFVLKVDQHEQV